MEKIKITRENVNSFLKTRHGNKYYFKFPGIDKTLIVETHGAGTYWPSKMSIVNGKAALDVEALRKEEVFRRASVAYKAAIKKLS